MMKILTINPGSTSTKWAIFSAEDNVLRLEKSKTIDHSKDELDKCADFNSHFNFRKRKIVDSIGRALTDIDVFVARGGLLMPIASGVYRVNDLMIEHLQNEIGGRHASNLAAPIAKSLAEDNHKSEVFIIDPVVVDEMSDLARISGVPEIKRRSIVHALNQRAVAIKYASSLGVTYESLHLVVAHMGGGVSIASHRKGRMVDVNNALDGEGPFTPERSGGLPVGDLVDLCFSKKVTKQEVMQKLRGRGGLVAYLGTHDAREIEQRIHQGDSFARTVYEAMIYQISKEIGAYSAVLDFEVDAILLTGGLAHSDYICDRITKKVSRVAPVLRFPGSDEEAAMAKGVFFALQGLSEIKEYTPHGDV
jgi:butyrate kinase